MIYNAITLSKSKAGGNNNMDIIIIDYRDIYSATVDDEVNSDDVLAAYMQISGETQRSVIGDQYIYRTTKHSLNHTRFEGKSSMI